MVREYDLGQLGDDDIILEADIRIEREYISPNHLYRAQKNRTVLVASQNLNEEDIKNLTPSELEYKLNSFVRVINSKTYDNLRKLHDVAISCCEIDLDRKKIIVQDELFEIKESSLKLIDDTANFKNSIKRGFRDLVRGETPKTELHDQIRDRIITPLRDYIAREDTKTLKPKSEIGQTLDEIEAQLLRPSRNR